MDIVRVLCHCSSMILVIAVGVRLERVHAASEAWMDRSVVSSSNILFVRRLCTSSQVSAVTEIHRRCVCVCVCVT
jgi:hypothetical protein